MNIPLIEFNNICKSFGQNEVLRGINLSVYKGEITTIIGKSGEGKSVLLKHIVGLITPDSGSILFNGKPLSGRTKAQRASLRKNSVTCSRIRLSLTP